MSGHIKKAYIAILIIRKSIATDYNFRKCIFLSNQQCITRPNLIDLNHNEYNEGLRYYQFTVNLERFNGNCNTLHDLSNRTCIPNKTEDKNLSVFNMIKQGYKKQIKKIDTRRSYQVKQ